MLLNISALETRYPYVPLFPLNISFSEALYHFKENSYKMRLRKLRYPFEGNLGWDHSPRKGHPTHDLHWTKIEIPYTLLVSPFFQQGLPRSLNYGGIGGVIASELAHTISIIGTKDNVKGEYKSSMTENSVASYKNRTSCFLKQYKAEDKKLLLELDDRYNENTSAEAA
ncbi:neprilysin-1-like, partial [Dermacentor silvarum]|uniref:neprilysin-1-like n=1 Tax=Dermacentor silvarum TaxID=543639 RepID=UPI002101B954